jgi:AcrR family transcriptional regulator
VSLIDPAWKPSIAFTQAMGGLPVPPPRVTPADAFEAARRHFLSGDRLDMVALAAELGVARATLYRWTGDRDRLLADVITAELVQLGEICDQLADGAGLQRLEQIIGRFVETLARAPALRALLANEGQNGLRMLTSPTGPIRPRIVQTLHQMICREVEAGAYRPPADPEILADGIVSLGERYLHNGGEPTLNPDPTSVRVIVKLLLREQPPD